MTEVVVESSMKTVVDGLVPDAKNADRSKDKSFDRLTTHKISTMQELASATVKKSFFLSRHTRFESYAILLGMLCSLFLMDAIIPLRSLWFHQALLTQLGTWPVWPTLLLFPGRVISPPISPFRAIHSPGMESSWGTMGLLLGVFLIVFLVYLFALRRLPWHISCRFILCSTLLIGLLYTLVPVLTSPDVYSYIAYARAGSLYHLNPLTATPLTIRNDVVYHYTGWVDQPSAYGPTWIGITCLLQYIFILCHLGGSILAMLETLRLLGLAAHLGSVALIWSLSGSLQSKRGVLSEQKRLLATLAFAWNPLLLLEACTNAHNDTIMLLLLLLVIWFLVRGQKMLNSYSRTLDRLTLKLRIKYWLMFLAPAMLLALGACLKINLIVLAPGLFFYQWQQENSLPFWQRMQRIATSMLTFCGLIVLLYMPFWQGGAVLHVFLVNPATDRTINTLPNTLSHLYNGIVADLGFPLGALIGSPAERFLHSVSMGLFIGIYITLCWQALRTPGSLRSIYSLVRWMALVWLFYCAIGSPWFWPWYLTTFLGLYALLEASQPPRSSRRPSGSGLHSLAARFRYWTSQIEAFLLYPATARMLTLSMFTLYCFTTFAAQQTFVPGLPGFQWSSFGGAWAWLLPFFFFKRATSGTTTLQPVERKSHKNSC